MEISKIQTIDIQSTNKSVDNFPMQKAVIATNIQNYNKTNLIEQKPKLSNEEVNKLSKELNDLAQQKNLSLNFTVDEKSGEKIIQFVDSQSKEIIKQIPSEEMLRVISQIDKFLEKVKINGNIPPGILLNKRI
jgi:flagellar protein FlaG